MFDGFALAVSSLLPVDFPELLSRHSVLFTFWNTFQRSLQRLGVRLPGARGPQSRRALLMRDIADSEDLAGPIPPRFLSCEGLLEAPRFQIEK